MSTDIIKSIVTSILNRKSILYLAGITFIVSIILLLMLKDFSIIDKPKIELALLISIAVFVIEIFSKIFRLSKRIIHTYIDDRNYILNLTPSEKKRLLEFINSNQKYLSFPIDDIIMKSLWEQRIVHRDFNTINMGNNYNPLCYTYYLSNYYNDLLINHKDWLDI